MSNVLTDEEIKDLSILPEVRFSLRYEEGIAFARAIERAVLAKAGEQELYKWFNPKSGNSVISHASKMTEGTEDLYADWSEPLYAHPAPQKAIPEWQPIETAPEDEYVLLIEKHDKIPFVGYKKKGSWFENIVNAEVVGDAYIRTSFEPEWLIGFMPLPEPPKD